MSVQKLFAKYVSQNVLGMLGISLYILADTLFISLAEGADGITALNLVLPVYSLIFAIGAMIGVGSAIRFNVLRAQKKKEADQYFSNAVIFACIFGSVFTIAGLLIPDKIVEFLGGDPEIIAVGTSYTRTFLLFSPFFMLNHIFNAFIRNDGAPSRAMTATLCSSLINIVGDYILMFPFKMGMTGAALATGISPIVGVLICSTHFLSPQNTIKFRFYQPSIRRLGQVCALGVSAFVGEISSGVTTAVFNFLILKLAGNNGVAAYGVVANTALVATSVFNGISQGTQPLLSDFYGKRENAAVKKVLGLGIFTAVVLAAGMILIAYIFTGQIVGFFNSGNVRELAEYAFTGVRLYFLGFLFAGFNIVGTGYLGATEAAGWAFTASVLRGFIAIVLCAVILSILFGMNGVWLAFPVAELMTAVVTIVALYKTGRKNLPVTAD